MARPKKNAAVKPVLTLEKLRKYCDDNRRVYVDLVLMEGDWYIYAQVPGTGFEKMTQVRTERSGEANTMIASRLWNMVMKITEKLPEIQPRIVAGANVYECVRPSRTTEIIRDALQRCTPLQRTVACNALALDDLGAGMEASILNTILYRRGAIGDDTINKALGAIGLELSVLES